MGEYQVEYQRWCELVKEEDLKEDLLSIQGNEEEIRGRFSAPLAFGTAGMRGILAAGTNRMNVYTVARATQGLADYLNETKENPKVAIAYDSRIKSEEFAHLTASVLAANGVQAWVYPELMPVPMLSFAVRFLRCDAGIMITASHNPSEYNGYKVYGSDGCQMTDHDANAVLEKIEKLDYFSGIQKMPFECGLEQGKIEWIKSLVTSQYMDYMLGQRIEAYAPEEAPIRIVYTPLNGAGNKPVRQALAMSGHRDVIVVPEQENPDGRFPTCPYPNPEMMEAKKLGLELCAQVHPDIFIATDPDADRVGVAFPEKDGTFRPLTGNEAGVLMLDYIIKGRTRRERMPENPIAVRSIVSTALADEIARDGGVEMRTVLTGFKYIGEQILLLEEKGEEDRFIFGFEESCGYLSGSYARDKDGVYAAVILCELTSYYKSIGTTPLEVLDGIYEKYGYYRNRVANIAFPGADGPSKMKQVMSDLRANRPASIAGFAVCEFEDILESVHVAADGTTTSIQLPKSDVLSFLLENGARVIVRPSGTEPKMKVYITAKEPTPQASEALCAQLEQATKELMGLE